MTRESHFTSSLLYCQQARLCETVMEPIANESEPGEGLPPLSATSSRHVPHSTSKAEALRPAAPIAMSSLRSPRVNPYTLQAPPPPPAVIMESGVELGGQLFQPKRRSTMGSSMGSTLRSSKAANSPRMHNVNSEKNIGATPTAVEGGLRPPRRDHSTPTSRDPRVGTPGKSQKSSLDDGGVPSQQTKATPIHKEKFGSRLMLKSPGVLSAAALGLHASSGATSAPTGVSHHAASAPLRSKSNSHSIAPSGGAGTTGSSQGAGNNPDTLHASKDRTYSRLIPGRMYYGGIYYAPPATMVLDRHLTAMFHNFTGPNGLALALQWREGGADSMRQLDFAESHHSLPTLSTPERPPEVKREVTPPPLPRASPQTCPLATSSSAMTNLAPPGGAFLQEGRTGRRVVTLLPPAE